jgi:hypothetical protein
VGAGGRAPNGQQIKEILETFLAAFNREELREMVEIDLEESLDAIVADDNRRTTIFELILWAKRQGRVAQLINAAVGRKSKTPEIAELARKAATWGLEAPINVPGGGASPSGTAQPAGSQAGGQNVSGTTVAGNMYVTNVSGGGPVSIGGAQPTPQPQETGPQLTATLALKMAYVPTAVIHLLDPNQYPVVQVEVTNTASRPRRLRVISAVEGYSSTWSDTVELGTAGSADATTNVLQQPLFKREALRTISERLLAGIRTQVEDLDAQRVQLDMTKRIWMLPINSAPVRVKDEVTSDLRDMLPYLGAFVTRNEASIQAYLPTVAANHPKRQLAGYYAADSVGDSVRSQVRALTAALKPKLSYATALVETVADSAYQRVRLPRECLAVGQANCLEGTLLYCSLLEAMGLQSAVVWAREHAVAAWIENPAKPDAWSFLDPTKVANGTFETAMEWGETIYADNKDKGPDAFRILPIRDLRAQGITPLE